MPNGEELSPWGHALAGAMGAVFSNAAVYPLDTIKTRIQVARAPSQSANNSNKVEGYEVGEVGQVEKQQKPTSTISLLNQRRLAIIASLMKVVKEEGIGGYYQGFTASMVNTFSMQYAYFFFYALVRSLYNKRVRGLASSRPGLASPPPISTAAELLIGALAGALAQIFTIPVSVIATRQQLDDPPTATKDGDGKKVGFWGVAKEIIDEDGIQGLWRGIKPSLVLTVNPSITYGAFERIKAIILKESGKDKLSPGMAFLVGALSKTMATIVTYPYIMAKVRLQAKFTPSPPTPLEPSQQQDPIASPPSVAVLYADAVKSCGASSSSTPAEEEGAASKRLSQKNEKIGAGQERYKSAIDVLTKVYKEKGFGGWYQGMTAQIIKAVLSQGILFMLKDQFEHYALVLMMLMGSAEKAAIKALPNV